MVKKSLSTTTLAGSALQQSRTPGTELGPCYRLEHQRLECSPYAAHLFDAEDPYTPVRHLPGLCFAYCSEFHSKCHSVVKYLTNSRTLLETCEKDRSHFCNLINLADQDYCYPNVLR
ncbi:hypothetical protein cypCar_00021688, partial [Cyprinus carpio]